MKPLASPVRGKACVVLSERVEGPIHRGLVMFAGKSEATFSIYFVDLGITDLIKSTCLFEIPPPLMETPLLSIRASLADAEIFDVFESVDVSDAFSQLIESHSFIARVSDDSTSSPPQKLHLRNLEGRDVKDLILYLLKNRSVSPTPVPIELKAVRVNLKV